MKYKIVRGPGYRYSLEINKTMKNSEKIKYMLAGIGLFALFFRLLNLIK